MNSIKFEKKSTQVCSITAEYLIKDLYQTKIEVSHYVDSVLIKTNSKNLILSKDYLHKLNEEDVVELNNIKQPSYKSNGLDCTLVLCPKELAEKLSTLTFYQFVEELENFSKNLQEKELTPLYVYYSGHMIFDVDDNPVPLKLQCDYITEQINSSTYDLFPMRAHLAKNPIVSGLAGIKKIPYYNNDSGQDTYFSFSFCPDKDSLKEAFEIAKEKCPEYPSTAYKKILLESMDILEIQQFKRKDIRYDY